MSLENLIQNTVNLNWQEKLKYLSKNHDGLILSTSFSIEDQVITDFISRNKLNIKIFAIDTGRLPNETYDVWSETLKKYNIKISPFYPKQNAIEDYVSQNGINAFYESKDLRFSCCAIRKVEPLNRALEYSKIWISGIRKAHSVSRETKEFFENDEARNLIKFYPILNLSEDEIWGYIKENNVPYNKLYNQGYKSIGCAPCSRAVKDGEDVRAGRWWWEDGAQECGLHMVNGKLAKINKSTLV
jgi:phosphoadenosine phosphosulfate reductase